MRHVYLGILFSFGVSCAAMAATSPSAASKPRCDSWTLAKMEYNAASSNLANMETTRTPEGGPYEKKVVKLLPDGKCQVESVRSFKSVYEPGHPDANHRGYVQFPDINMVEELNNLTKARDQLNSLQKKNPKVSRRHVDPDIDFD